MHEAANVALEAAATARAAPLVAELRVRKPKVHILEFAPLPLEAGREMLRARLLRLTGDTPTSKLLQPVLSHGLGATRPSWLSALAINLGRAALADRLTARVPVSSVGLGVALNMSAMLSRPKPASPRGVAPGMAPGMDALRVRLKDGATLRSDEAELIRQATISMQSQLTRLQLSGIGMTRNPAPLARDDARDDARHGAAPSEGVVASARRALPSTLAAAALMLDETAHEESGLSPMQCEAAGLRIALRLLTLLSVSGHGLGLSEAHAYALLRPELPVHCAGAVWAYACEHVALFVGQPAAGIWTLPHQAVGQGLRAGLLNNGPGTAEHEELAQHYLCCLDPQYDGSFGAHDGGTSAGGAGEGGDEPAVLIGAPWHLWRAGVAQRPTLIGLLRTAGYAMRLATVMAYDCLPHQV